MTQLNTGVGVLDKAMVVLAAVEAAPASLAELVVATDLPRPTAYRLAVALETHGMLRRDQDGRFVLGHRLVELAAGVEQDEIDLTAPGVLASLRDATRESAQLYRRRGDVRVCVAAAEPVSGLRDTVPVGSQLPMTAGSAAQVLLAWEPAESAAPLLAEARFTASTLATVRRRGWAASVGEREAGVASVSAPVFSAAGLVVAALSVSGPIDRLTRSPGKLHGESVANAALSLSTAAGWKA